MGKRPLASGSVWTPVDRRRKTCPERRSASRGPLSPTPSLRTRAHAALVLLLALIHRGDAPIVKWRRSQRLSGPLTAIRVVGRTNDTLSFQTAEGREVRLLPLALGTVIEETPGVRRFQAIKTAPKLLSIRLEAEPGTDLLSVWERVDMRLRDYLSAQGLSVVNVERSPEPPQPNPVSGKFRQVWAEV